VFDALTGEIRLSFDYFHRQFPDVKIDRLLVCAGKTFNNWIAGLGKELNIEAELNNPIATIEGGSECHPEFSIACGLALRKFYEPHTNPNLAPIFKAEELKKLMGPLAIGLGVGLVLVLGVQAIMSAGISKLETRLEKVIKQGEPLLPVDSEVSIEQVKGLKTKYKNQLSSIKGIIDARKPVTVRLSRLSQLMPEGVWLTDISMGSTGTGGTGRQRGRGSSYSSGTITLLGRVYTETSGKHIKLANKFLNNLKEDADFSAGFSEIKMESINQSTVKDLKAWNFKIICITEQ